MTREAHLWAAAGIHEGAVVADVGCGPGAVLVMLAERVGRAGAVIGIDADETAVASAVAAARDAGLQNATARTGSADRTGLPLASFDIVVMRHVLAHNGTKAQLIVDHLARLLRPGGTVYLVDTDATDLVIEPGAHVFDKMFRRYVDWHAKQGNDLRTGRYLSGLARSAGLRMVAVEDWVEDVSLSPGVYGPPWAARQQMLADGSVNADELIAWSAELAEADLWAQRPVVHAPTFAVVARRAPWVGGRTGGG